MSSRQFEISDARSDEDLAFIRSLFREYEASLGIGLCFQGFEAELAELPGKYSPPAGALLLARDLEGAPIGCVACRPTDVPDVCEMKRLYVSRSVRGLGLGRALVGAIIAAAARAGYREMRLDTLPDMAEAVALYISVGFEPIPAYYETPIAETLFLAIDLK